MSIASPLHLSAKYVLLISSSFSNIMARQSPVLAPRRLFVQIVELQAVYYALGLIMISFTLVVMGLPWHARYIFSWEEIRPDTTLGWTLAMLWLMDTFLAVLALAVIVGRSKLALDFALTLHGINLVVAWVSSGRFPRSWLWWVLQVVSSVLMIYLGIWTTQWRELRRTFFEDYELADIDRSQRGESTEPERSPDP